MGILASCRSVQWPWPELELRALMVAFVVLVGRYMRNRFTAYANLQNNLICAGTTKMPVQSSFRIVAPEDSLSSTFPGREGLTFDISMTLVRARGRPG